MPACQKCNESFPNYVSIKDKVRNISKRKYCLSCSPFGKHNTKKLHLYKEAPKGMKHCSSCSQILPHKSFYNKRTGGHHYWCKECCKKEAANRIRKHKQLAIEYKGGKCEGCGYDKCPAALDFHHRDPSKKSFSISRSKSWKFDERAKKELDKCCLVCSNCHREIEAGFRDCP